MALLSLLLAALQLDPADRMGYWTCQKHHPAPDGALWVRRILEPAGTLVYEEIVWRGQKDGLPTGMTWRLDRKDALVPNEFEAFLVWSRAPRRPVTLVIDADGKAERRPFVSGRQLSYFRREGWAPLQIWYSTAFPADGAVPSLHGVRQASIRAVEDGGARVGSAPLALPDWSWLDSEVARARRALDGEMRDPARHCQRAEPPSDQLDPGSVE